MERDRLRKQANKAVRGDIHASGNNSTVADRQQKEEPMLPIMDPWYPSHVACPDPQQAPCPTGTGDSKAATEVHSVLSGGGR